MAASCMHRGHLGRRGHRGKERRAGKKGRVKERIEA